MRSLQQILCKVVSIGRLTAFYVVFLPLEYIPSRPPHQDLRHSYCTEIPLIATSVGQTANIICSLITNTDAGKLFDIQFTF